MDEERDMLMEQMVAAETAMRKYAVGTKEYSEAADVFIRLNELYTERMKANSECYCNEQKLRIDEEEKKERRRIDEKSINGEIDAKLKEILLETKKLKVTPDAIFKAAVGGISLLAVLNYESVAVVTSKAFSPIFRKAFS